MTFTAADDPHQLFSIPLFQDLYGDRTGKVAVSRALVPGEHTTVLVPFGQSMQGTHHTGDYAATNTRVHNFDFQTGFMCAAANPLLGATAYTPGYEHSGVRLADKLIDAGLTQRVILAPMAVNGAWIAILTGTEGMRRIRSMCRYLVDSGLANADRVFILCNLGESDAFLGTSRRAFRDGMLSIIDAFRDNGVNATFFVSLCTWIAGQPAYGNHAYAEAIRGAQADAVTYGNNAATGVDTDTLDNTYRDGTFTHFNAAGSAAHASLWLSALRPHF